MSSQQEYGRRTSTSVPPRSYGRADPTSVVASSCRRSGSMNRSRGGSKPATSFWRTPDTEPDDRKNQSRVTFGGRTSVAPSDSISKMNSRPGRQRESFNYDGEASSYSRRSRRRSAPWEDHDYRSTHTSKARSSQGGTAWSGDRAPLTENNLEEFNETRPPKSEVSRRDVEQEVPFEEIDVKSRKSRRDSGFETQSPRTRTGWTAADDNWTNERGDRTVVSSWRRADVRDDRSGEEVGTKLGSRSRYTSLNPSGKASNLDTYSQRQSRYMEAQDERYTSSSFGRQSQRGGTSTHPPTMPPEKNDHNQSSAPHRTVANDAAGAAAGVAIASAVGSRMVKSQAPTQYYQSNGQTQGRGTEAGTERCSSRKTDAQAGATEAETQHSTERDVEMESQAIVSRTRAPSQPAQPMAVTTVGSATSPWSSPSGPTSAQPPTAPDDYDWERRVRIIETRQRDGKLIWEREVSMRGAYPQEPQVVA